MTRSFFAGAAIICLLFSCEEQHPVRKAGSFVNKDDMVYEQLILDYKEDGEVDTLMNIVVLPDADSVKVNFDPRLKIGIAVSRQNGRRTKTFHVDLIESKNAIMRNDFSIHLHDRADHFLNASRNSTQVAFINSGFASDGGSWLFISEELLTNELYYSKVKKYLAKPESGIELDQLVIVQHVSDSRGVHSYMLW
jgi:hypothetical protein